jgi:hypothetical protein
MAQTLRPYYPRWVLSYAQATRFESDLPTVLAADQALGAMSERVELPAPYEWGSDGRSVLAIGDDSEPAGELLFITERPFWLPPKLIAALQADGESQAE